MSAKTLNFDNFIREKKEEPVLVTVFGKEYPVAPHIPAMVPIMMARANDAATEGEVAMMLVRAGDIMFGKDAIDEMCAKGLTSEELGDLIKKTFAVINGQDVDGDDAEEMSDEDSLVSPDKAKK